MKWETINIKEINKKYRFSVVLNWRRYQQLLLLMKSLKTKQHAKAINFLIDQYTLEQELMQMLEEEKK